ncbi:MAG: ParA family partition ATPase [Pseudomonadota bacterium]
MGQVISFAQQKGGAGKTTVLIHLAEAWRRAGRSVALVDLDPQRSLASWAEAAPEKRFEVIESAGWRGGGDVRTAGRHHDMTLVDCPGNASSLLEAALRESQLVLVPCQPTGPDVWATGAILKMATSERVPARILLNRVPPRGGSIAEAVIALKSTGAEILTTRIGNRVAFSSGLIAGKTAYDLGRRSTAVSEVEALAAELDTLLGTSAEP